MDFAFIKQAYHVETCCELSTIKAQRRCSHHHISPGLAPWLGAGMRKKQANLLKVRGRFDNSSDGSMHVHRPDVAALGDTIAPSPCKLALKSCTSQMTPYEGSVNNLLQLGA